MHVLHVSLYMSCVCCRRYYTVIDGIIRSAVEYKYILCQWHHISIPQCLAKNDCFIWLFVYVLYAGVRLVTSIDGRESDVLQSASLFLQNGSSTENSGQWIVRCSSTTSLVSMMSSICSFICKQFANTLFKLCKETWNKWCERFISGI